MTGKYSFIRDFTTVLRKESRELYVNIAGPRGRLGFIAYMAVFGVILPLQTGRDWIETPVALASWAWLPVLIVSSATADMIAGERERHTLETLLAGRLPDSAIYAGKTVASILYGCIQVWIMAIASAFAVNLAFRDGGIVFYSLPMLAAIVVIPILLGMLSAGIAALLSVGAETARQAQQVMSVVSILLVLPVFLVNLVPQDLRVRLLLRLSGADWNLLAVVIPAGVLALALILLYAGSRRFTRYELLKERGGKKNVRPGNGRTR